MKYKGIEIVCPVCKADLREDKGDECVWFCLFCRRKFPVVFEIPDLRVFPDPYIDAEADRAKGLHVGARFNELSFAELVDFYYSITPAVPPQHARQYTRGLMAGIARAEATLSSWESSVDGNGRARATTVLDVGCGTAPFLAAAACRYEKLVGVDIAFRWLVVAKKRLAEAHSDVPLICACAEALPFPDGMFDRIVADSVLEHLSDQPQGLNEIFRVMRPSGYLFVSTPNKYSLGPDPHAGIWGGGLLPESWIAAYVRHKGGIPPKRNLLSARSLSRLVEKAGFSSLQLQSPRVSKGQRRHFGKGMRLLIDVYELAKRLPVSRPLLEKIGPLLHAVSRKPSQAT